MWEWCIWPHCIHKVEILNIFMLNGSVKQAEKEKRRVLVKLKEESSSKQRKWKSWIRVLYMPCWKQLLQQPYDSITVRNCRLFSASVKDFSWRNFLHKSVRNGGSLVKKPPPLNHLSCQWLPKNYQQNEGYQVPFMIFDKLKSFPSKD